MPRILGIDLPKEKKIEFSLCYLYGVGRALSRKILKEANINPDVRAKDLTDEEVSRITTILQKEYKVEGDLRREIAQNIKRLKEIGTWRGFRHARKLPIRGRSKTNSRTLRGNVRKTMGTGRRAVEKK